MLTLNLVMVVNHIFLLIQCIALKKFTFDDKVHIKIRTWSIVVQNFSLFLLQIINGIYLRIYRLHSFRLPQDFIFFDFLVDFYNFFLFSYSFSVCN